MTTIETNDLTGEPQPPPGKPVDVAARQSSAARLIAKAQRRILAGLLFALPFVITIWIVYWLYTVLNLYVIGPAARLVVTLAEGGHTATLPPWFVDYGAPLIGLTLVAALLYFLGFFAQARVDRLLDAVLLRLPLITRIHKSVRRLFTSLQGQGEFSRFQRAVLVAFPHPGIRVPAFVTSSCRDESTQQNILCVYVPTTPMPSSGYMLLIPESEVTELNWTLEETLQAVVSFGLTAPPHVSYFGKAWKPTGNHARGAVEQAQRPAG